MTKHGKKSFRHYENQEVKKLPPYQTMMVITRTLRKIMCLMRIYELKQSFTANCGGSVYKKQHKRSKLRTDPLLSTTLTMYVAIVDVVAVLICPGDVYNYIEKLCWIRFYYWFIRYINHLQNLFLRHCCSWWWLFKMRFTLSDV